MDTVATDGKKIISKYESSKKKAENLLKRPMELKEELDNAFNKINSLTDGPLAELIEDIKLMINLVKDYISGEYKEVPKYSIIAIVGGFIYFVSPIDLIADFIPGGYIDDVFVIALVLKQVHFDLEKYKEWKLNCTGGNEE